MNDDAIVTEVKGAIAIVRFNRPARRNTLSTPVLNQLDRIVSEISNNDDLHTLIFTGTNDVFLSGADIRELSQLDPNSARVFSARGQAVMQHIAGAKQTTIAAINGYCMGGGLDLALACARRIASPAAVFAHPGVQLGIITGWGGTQRLPRLIGTAKALEMFLTARRVTATEALEIGLIDDLDPSPVEFAIQLARDHSGKK